METTPTHLHTPQNKDASGRIFSKLTQHHVSRKAALLMTLATTVPVAVQFADADYSSIVEAEKARRAGLVRQADEAIALGRAAYAKKDYEEAVKQYKTAVSILPPGPALADRRNSYAAHLGDASVALSQQYRRDGKYAEARTMMEAALRENPTNLRARKELEYLDDPIRTNPALNYAHTQKVDRVRKHLYTAQGAFNLGKLDQAEREYTKVLQIDKYNKAARRGLERVAVYKSDYYGAAYDHTRAELLREVDAAWELAVPPEVPTVHGREVTGGQATGVQLIQEKLNTIIIPRVNFDNDTVEEALDFLRLRARELDPQGRGVNILVREGKLQAAGGGAADGDGEDLGDGDGLGGGGVNPGTLRIKSLNLTDVPLGQVLQYICDATRLRIKLDEHSVMLLPLGTAGGDDLYTRTFVVPPNFISELDKGEEGEAVDDPFAGGGGLGKGDTLKARPSAKELLKRSGVSFPEKGSANYFAGTSTLVVRNTLANLDVIEQIVEVMRKKGPRQVRIRTKFIEVSQENTDELGFDWIISPVGLNGSSTFLGGGTVGNGAVRTGADFISPVNFTTVPGVPAGSTQQVSNTATSGLRSGDFATTRNSIDAILNNPTRTAQSGNVAPGILSLTGLYTDGQVQMIMRGLAQKKGTDVMTAPSVLARSGEKASIEVIREFIYPTEYEPPELPNSVGTGGGLGGGGGLSGGSIFPVTPATPTAFETESTGVTLEILPNIGDNNQIISLDFAPQLVEFEGFINYGSPIQSPASDALGNPIQITITENRIEMPVFSKRKVTTQMDIYDGYTVAVGGLMREDVQNVQDKVPILGDLPLIGRLFQTKAENRIKSNLIIFVTAEIIGADGARINQPGGAGVETPPGLGTTPAIDGPGIAPRLPGQ